MVCNCCIRNVEQILEKQDFEIVSIRLGELIIRHHSGLDIKEIENILNRNGFEVIHHKDEKLVEQIKTALIELIHHANYSNSLIRNSDYLVDKLGYSYAYLSGVFSKIENTTLEKYIILLKIEKVKELIEYDEFSLSEIAAMLGYSSVQYLSNQFKSIEGISVTEYKRIGSNRQSLDSI